MQAGLQEMLGGELGRILSTIVVIAAAMIFNHLNVRYQTSAARTQSKPVQGRQQLVLIKNVIILSAVLLIVVIWATKIAGVALSLSAFAVALVLSTKEIIMCITGYMLYVMSRPFSVGEHIELHGSQGIVTDVGLLNLTLSETNKSHQITGKTIILPNSVLLSAVVTNNHGLGTFMIGSVRLAVPYDTDRDALNAIAIEITTRVCEPWMSASYSHFQRLGSQSLLETPSHEIQVFWEAADIKQHWFEIRFLAPVAQQESIAQQISHQIWQQYGCTLSKSSQA